MIEIKETPAMRTYSSTMTTRALMIAVSGLMLSSACVSSDGGDGNCPAVPASSDCNPADADQRPHFITPLQLYTGANGRDVYEAVLVANFGALSVYTSDENIVCGARYGCLAPNDTGIAALITALAPGQATITVTSGSVTENIAVTVADYTPEQFDLGDERYNMPANANASDRMACSECHDGQGGAPHSPLALGGTSDADLLAAIETSKYPDVCENDDGVCNCTPNGTDCGSCAEADCRFSEGYTLTLEAFGGAAGEHTYNLTEAEKTAIMAYMRAIRPEGL